MLYVFDFKISCMTSFVLNYEYLNHLQECTSHLLKYVSFSNTNKFIITLVHTYVINFYPDYISVEHSFCRRPIDKNRQS